MTSLESEIAAVHELWNRSSGTHAGSKRVAGKTIRD
jgi:hypothetical protein